MYFYYRVRGNKYRHHIFQILDLKTKCQENLISKESNYEAANINVVKAKGRIGKILHINHKR